MKETIRTLENMLAAVMRSQDCPAPALLREMLMGDAGDPAHEKVLEHIKGCGYCRGEIKALAQTADIAVPAELLGYEAAALAATEARVRKVVKTLAPQELPDFASLWQLALVQGSEVGGRMPLAAEAFSHAGHSRATRIIHAALLLADQPDTARLDVITRKLRLTPKERTALAAEFIG
jgi:hypothetical protein